MGAGHTGVEALAVLLGAAGLLAVAPPPRGHPRSEAGGGLQQHLVDRFGPLVGELLPVLAVLAVAVLAEGT